MILKLISSSIVYPESIARILKLMVLIVGNQARFSEARRTCDRCFEFLILFIESDRAKQSGQEETEAFSLKGHRFIGLAHSPDR